MKSKEKYTFLYLFKKTSSPWNCYSSVKNWTTPDLSFAHYFMQNIMQETQDMSNFWTM